MFNIYPINTFQGNLFFLYPLKTSEKKERIGIFDLFRKSNERTLARNGLTWHIINIHS